MSDGPGGFLLGQASSYAGSRCNRESMPSLGPLGTGPDTPIPATLLHAVDALEDDKVVRGTLDAAGPGVAHYYAKLKRGEFFAHHAAASGWEHDRYLTAF